MICKARLSTFHLVGNSLVWKIGSSEQVLIGLDPWIGSKEEKKLSSCLICEFQRKGYYTLKKISYWNQIIG
jgi:hypothetical protein